MATIQFKNLSELLTKIDVSYATSMINAGRIIKQGEYYNKSLLSVLGEPTIIKPTNLKDYKTESDCERYTANYGDQKTFIAILPLRKDTESRDAREPIFLIKNDLADYFLSANIGYLGYNEMTFPDNLNVLRSVVQFPLNGFEIMSQEEVIQSAKEIDFYLFKDNFSAENGRDIFSGWKKQFSNAIITQIKADDRRKSRFNPMYFLAIHRDN